MRGRRHPAHHLSGENIGEIETHTILIEFKGEAAGIIDGAVTHQRRASDVLPLRIGIHVDVALPNPLRDDQTVAF